MYHGTLSVKETNNDKCSHSILTSRLYLLVSLQVDDPPTNVYSYQVSADNKNCEFVQLYIYIPHLIPQSLMMHHSSFSSTSSVDFSQLFSFIGKQMSAYTVLIGTIAFTSVTLDFFEGVKGDLGVATT